MKTGKYLKGLSLLLALLMVLSISVPKISTGAASKKIKLSSKKLTLEVGASKSLVLKKGKSKISKKIKWKSSNKKVATINSKGKIIAKKKGKATITATYKKKKYTCKVTVKAANKATPTPAPTPTEAPKPMISKTAISLNPGQYEVLELTLDGDTIKTGVTWSIENTSETPTGPASAGKLEVAHLRTSSRIDDRGKAYIIGEYGGTAKVTATYDGNTYTCNVTVAKGFDVKSDLKIEYSTTTIHIDFDLKTDESGNPDPKEVAELQEQGCTVNGKNVTKDQVCEVAKYKFTKLPKTVEEIKSLFIEAEKDDTVDLEEKNAGVNYGGFNAMAANICAANAFTWPANAADPHYSNSPQGWEIKEMFEFINGPYKDDDIANVQMTTAIDSMKAVYQSMGENGYKVYFKGAKHTNNYTPSEYTITMYKGPYYIKEQQTITGTRPTTYMIFVPGYETNASSLVADACEGFGADRYIDVAYSTKDARWYSFQNNFLHITANDHKKPEETR